MVLRQPAPYRPEAGAARPSGWSETGVVQAGTEPGRPGCLAKECSGLVGDAGWADAREVRHGGFHKEVGW